MITITECHPNQLDLLFKIAVQTYTNTYKYLWIDNGVWYLEKFYKKADFKKELLSSDIHYFLVYDSENIIGYFKLKNNFIAPYSETDCIEIDKLYLLKKYAGKGIGKTVMKFIIDFAHKHDRPIIWLKVMEDSLAKYFYEKQGFVMTDKNYLDYPAMKEEYRWLLTMIRKI
ncbi:GNAT family N-acetyltransferase [Flavobacterium sp. LC2016-01]|uniref:GNAT family N-acetyltransferase n=1 Tax=Flavobacterium sp. LC2016-01 TaxID=2675876 RepID=UPI0012BAAECE|nr:GNAT family N-acetyltransferase [Flavobacterium sp. LC2016-01]MTH17683.1 GNAT family N-acetyltransferase [Flavobacterium sp. LC2016-01]